MKDSWRILELFQDSWGIHRFFWDSRRILELFQDFQRFFRDSWRILEGFLKDSWGFSKILLEILLIFLNHSTIFPNFQRFQKIFSKVSRTNFRWIFRPMGDERKKKSERRSAWFFCFGTAPATSVAPAENKPTPLFLAVAITKFGNPASRFSAAIPHKDSHSTHLTTIINYLEINSIKIEIRLNELC